MPSYVSVNGNVLSAASVELMWDGKPYSILKIDYDDKVDPGLVKPTGGSAAVGRTAGTYELSLSVSMTKAEALKLFRDLTGSDKSKGITEKTSTLVLVAREGSISISDTFHGVRVISRKEGYDGSSSDAATMELTLSALLWESDGYRLTGGVQL